MNEDDKQRLKDIVPNITFTPDLYPEDGERFQRQLHDFILETKPESVVETGVYCGCSTVHILSALNKNDEGHLYSCDPAPEISMSHPRWTFFQESSYTALKRIYQLTGPWDIFLHDSNHFSFCQTFEYYVAWELLKPNGYLLSDDVTWGTPPHHAWAKFVARTGADEFQIGAVRGIQKPHLTQMHNSDAVFDAAWAAATAAQEAAGDKELAESGKFR